MTYLKGKFALIILFLLLIGNVYGQISIGVFADCQYCNCESSGTRYYKNSYNKLQECIRNFNRDKDVFFVVGLGDIIDHGYDNLVEISKLMRTSNRMIFHVPGNHDYSVEESQVADVHKQLNIVESYYALSKKGWMFIFLNGNEVSLQSPDPEMVKQAENWMKKLTSEGKPNANTWNGALSEKQLNYLDNQLKLASQRKLNVAVFCHYPLYPLEAHSLWNSEEVLSTLEKYSCVKLWMNGHNHEGGYILHNGINFVNLKGMVETETDNAFAKVVFGPTYINIEGFGREPGRAIPIVNPISQNF